MPTSDCETDFASRPACRESDESGCGTAPTTTSPTIITWAQHCAAGIAAEYPAARLILNLTGGNKLMTIGFLQAFRACAEIIYCDTGNAAASTTFTRSGAPAKSFRSTCSNFGPILPCRASIAARQAPDSGGDYGNVAATDTARWSMGHLAWNACSV
jgi:hypothetical protein